MNLQDLKQKLVAVLGYGQEGKAVTSYLLKHGIKPVLFDQKPWNEWLAEEQEAIKKLELNFIFGLDAFLELNGFDVVFRSPGIRLADVASAFGGPSDKKQGKALPYITSQSKWFFEHCPAKIIGVTGTKGKGTTSSLIYEILKGSAPIHRQTKKPINGHATSYLTGNIGKTQPFEILDDLAADDYVVYELSSFQLQDLDQSPHIAVVLMVTSEHLDYHKDQHEYVDAKSSITKFQKTDDFAVINADFENSLLIGKQGNGKKFYFSRTKILETGCFVDRGQIIFKAPDLSQWASSALAKPGSEDAHWALNSKFSLPILELQLKGAHNLENVCAAVSVGEILGIDNTVIHEAIINFKGLEHRLEFVAEKNGIKFYNDSFSTTPETAIAAINAFDESEIVILGGSSKNSDFSELGKIIVGKKNIKALILIGQENQNISFAINKAGGFNGKILQGAKSMQEIFVQIQQVATSGDVVILSPACASFDMFSNYKERGELFKNIVKNF